MDIPLEDIDFGILSHAHYDHANGMEYFFARNRNAKFYLQKSCAENCYAHEEGRFRYIGIPKDLLAAYQDRLIYTDGDAALCDGVYVVAHKRKNREKSVSGSRCIRRKTVTSFPITLTMSKVLSLRRKRTRHLQFLFPRRRGGHHPGSFRNLPRKKVFSLIGGFHLFNKTDEEILRLAEQIRETGIESVYTGHCTGDRAFALLKGKLGSMAEQLKVGLSIEF